MQIMGSKLEKYPILSMHLAGKIAEVKLTIVSPHNLKVIGFLVDGPMIGREVGEVLDTQSVREFSRIGMIINSEDDLRMRGDIIKIEEVLNLGFDLVGKKMITKKGTKLGRIVDFVMDTESFMIMNLIVRRPLLKAINDPELVVGRKQVVEINNSFVVVKDEEEKIKKEVRKKDFVPNFSNPFREPNFAIEPKRRSKV